MGSLVSLFQRFLGLGGKEKVLLALDFDNTVIHGNTDVTVQDDLRDVPRELTQTYKGRVWTDFMQEVFNFLHSQGVRQHEMKEAILRLKLVRGMADFLIEAMRLREEGLLEIIIISDSNTIFIDWFLERDGIEVDRVYTNPATYNADESEPLQIKWHHVQEKCQLSEPNLCKGQLLQDYINQRKRADNVKFKRVVYCGDGKNDMCPALRLSKSDVICARKKYKLAQMLMTVRKSERRFGRAEIWDNASTLIPLLSLENNKLSAIVTGNETLDDVRQGRSASAAGAAAAAAANESDATAAGPSSSQQQ